MIEPIALDALTSLYVADMARALAFWRDGLGLVECYRFPAEGPPAHVELRVAGTRIALTNAEGLTHHGLPPATPGHPFEISLRVADTDAAVERLVAAGATLFIAPMPSPAGNRVAYLLDPDGNRVQLYARPNR